MIPAPDARSDALADSPSAWRPEERPDGLGDERPLTSHVPWWRDAVCYQIYVRSFADGDGNGIGDLPGIESRLPYVAGLGVDAIWLTPFYPSPQHDHGYDVADYRDVDPRFGTLADFDRLEQTAHRLGLKVIVDVVPNHTSVDHPWFAAALAAGPASPERARYIFRPGGGSAGDQPPNDWRSMFGGPAWSRVEDGEWYLHLFDGTQPDLNWRNAEVVDEFDDILRFWLDRGVDGFRIDVAHGLLKADGLPDGPSGPGVLTGPTWDQPEVHDVYRRWRRLLESYPGDRMAIAEAWAADADRMARYVRPDELHQAFNFHWLEAPWSAAAFREVVDRTYAAVDSVGASPTWVLSNHDVVREVTRYGDGAVGVSRSKAASLTMLALPGSAYLYQGQELGLPEVDVPPERRQDPMWLRGGGVGRDGCRVPMPWEGDAPPYGFSPSATADSWLPQPADWASLTVRAQQAWPQSTLNFFREALRARRQLVSRLDERLEFAETPDDVLAFRREPGFTCVLNCGSAPFELATLGDLGRLLVTSGPAADVGEGRLLPDAAAWFGADA